VVSKSAPAEKAQGGARTVTDEQIAHIKTTILEKIPQGWTIRQVLAEPNMMRTSASNMLARSNCATSFGAEEMVEIAVDDRTNLNCICSKCYADAVGDVLRLVRAIATVAVGHTRNVSHTIWAQGVCVGHFLSRSFLEGEAGRLLQKVPNKR
jgi:hypothetical protein